MKRIIVCLLAMLTALMTLSACSGGDMPEEVKTEDIYGIWSCTLPYGGELTYRFNKNNLYVMTDASGESGKGHYTVTDNKVCMFPEKGAGYIDCEI